MFIIRSGMSWPAPRHIDQRRVVRRDDRAAPARRRSGGRLVRNLASLRDPSSGAEPELLKADIDRPTHLALTLPLRLARPLAPGRMQAVASWTTRLRCVRLIDVFVLERLSQTLQLKNERRTLRPNPVIVRLADPAPRGLTVMPGALPRSHG
jgi:hypothetical protein